MAVIKLCRTEKAGRKAGPALAGRRAKVRRAKVRKSRGNAVEEAAMAWALRAMTKPEAVART